MSDPLSVIASIVGIIAAAGKISEILKVVISTAHEAPKIITDLILEMGDVRAAFSSLQTLLNDLSSALPHQAALTQIDQLTVTLTETKFTLSELEGLITPLVLMKGGKYNLKTRLKWTRVEGSCDKIVERLQRQKASVSLMLNILQCRSDAEAARSRANLELRVSQLFQSNDKIPKRLDSLEDARDACSAVTKKFGNMSFRTQDDNESMRTTRPQDCQSDPLTYPGEAQARFSFDKDLETSRVYSRVAMFDHCDRSFDSSTIRTSAWSIFSGVSLADISIKSVVALPIYPSDVENQEHYSSGDFEATLKSEPSGTWSNNQSKVRQMNDGGSEERVLGDTLGRVSRPADFEKNAGLSTRHHYTDIWRNEVHRSAHVCMEASTTQQKPRIRNESSFEPDNPKVYEFLSNDSREHFIYVPAMLEEDGEGSQDESGEEIEDESKDESHEESGDKRQDDSEGVDEDEIEPRDAIRYTAQKKSQNEAQYEDLIGRHGRSENGPLIENVGSSIDTTTRWSCKGYEESMGSKAGFALSAYRWNSAYFKCSKCGTTFDTRSDLLYTEDGTLVCNDCAPSFSTRGVNVTDFPMVKHNHDSTICHLLYMLQL